MKTTHLKWPGDGFLNAIKRWLFILWAVLNGILSSLGFYHIAHMLLDAFAVPKTQSLQFMIVLTAFVIFWFSFGCIAFVVTLLDEREANAHKENPAGPANPTE